MPETSRADARPLPLAGVRVLDLTRLLPGPLCARHLADLGAEVVKVEDPRVGDYARPEVRRLVNRGKQGLAVDLKTPEGREIFLRLAAQADVVVESFRPGVMDRLGVGYETLAAARPSLIYCAISGYGQQGERRDAAGHDVNYLATCGVLDQTGSAGGPPVIPGFLIADLVGGALSAAMGILAALLDARASGRGRFVDVSMTDAVMAHCIVPTAEFNEAGAVHARGTGTHNGGLPRYALYEARDGRWLAVGAQEKKFWDLLCDALELPQMKAQHQPSSNDAPQVADALRRAFKRRDAREWMTILGPLDCCVALVLTFEEALADATFASRGTVRRQPAGLTLGLPFVMSELPDPTPLPAPARGEHGEAILARLGYAPDAVRDLRARGII